jgi:hypothetical protein
MPDAFPSAVKMWLPWVCSQAEAMAPPPLLLDAPLLLDVLPLLLLVLLLDAPPLLLDAPPLPLLPPLPLEVVPPLLLVPLLLVVMPPEPLVDVPLPPPPPSPEEEASPGAQALLARARVAGSRAVDRNRTHDRLCIGAQNACPKGAAQGPFRNKTSSVIGYFERGDNSRSCALPTLHFIHICLRK